MEQFMMERVKILGTFPYIKASNSAELGLVCRFAANTVLYLSALRAVPVPPSSFHSYSPLAQHVNFTSRRTMPVIAPNQESSKNTSLLNDIIPSSSDSLSALQHINVGRGDQEPTFRTPWPVRRCQWTATENHYILISKNWLEVNLKP
eukprot:scaffold8_cov142-Skeletonema_marinoi.AAC.9